MQRRAGAGPLVHPLEFVEQVLTVRGGQVELVERGGDVRHQVEHAQLFLLEDEGELLPERVDVETRVDHGGEAVVVEVLRLDERVFSLVDEVVEDSRLALVENLRDERPPQVLGRHPPPVPLRDHRRPCREPQALTVVPGLVRLLPDDILGEVRRAEDDLRPLNAGLDPPDVLLDLGDVVLEDVLGEPEIVVVEEPLGVPSQPEDELRDELEVVCTKVD